MNLSIKLNLKGWEEQIQAIEKAGLSVNNVCDKVIREDAQIMNEELKSQMKSSNVPSDLISRMDSPEITSEGNRYYARVGYEKGAYNPDNPSDGYKVVFLNYGTPNRTVHGKIVARGFIQKAKRAAKTKINKANKASFNQIIEELKK